MIKTSNSNTLFEAFLHKFDKRNPCLYIKIKMLIQAKLQIHYACLKLQTLAINPI